MKDHLMVDPYIRIWSVCIGSVTRSDALWWVYDWKGIFGRRGPWWVFYIVGWMTCRLDK